MMLFIMEFFMKKNMLCIVIAALTIFGPTFASEAGSSSGASSPSDRFCVMCQDDITEGQETTQNTEKKDAHGRPQKDPYGCRHEFHYSCLMYNTDGSVRPAKCPNCRAFKDLAAVETEREELRNASGIDGAPAYGSAEWLFQQLLGRAFRAGIFNQNPTSH
jgi:hypothetical protein